jgi:hypothetical protein
MGGGWRSQLSPAARPSALWSRQGAARRKVAAYSELSGERETERERERERESPVCM